MDMALPNKKKINEYLSEFFKILQLEATYEILDYLNDHGNSHHKDLKQMTSTFTLSHRLINDERISQGKELAGTTKLVRVE